MIRFENVYKKYDNGTVALDNININIGKGEFVFLIGPSGAGKSTMLKVITREEKVTRGSVFLDSINTQNLKRRQIPYHRRNLGVVFQDYKLLENKTVYENVAFALEILGASKKEIKREVPIALSLVNLSHKTKSYPRELSGGELQRVSIARSIVNNPKVLLADEPTGNLDEDTSYEIMSLLMDINRRGTTIVMATHARFIVDKYQKRVISINQGKIVSDEIGGYHIENV